jgi:glycosyltransferase involved in cell wall biosynthesis
MLSTLTSLSPTAAEIPLRTPQIDVVVPVYNEEVVLARSIHRLHTFLCTGMPFGWRIVIADNASTDATPEIARTLASSLPNVDVITLPLKGRGRALRTAWMSSHADVVCYMDVDLSTDLRALLPLVAGLVSGHSDVAIGTRLSPCSRVERGRKRELISRGYNHLLRLVLGAKFSDAQCGFKAVRTDVARRLLPAVADNGWFFDTELLLLAQREGLRVHEVSVDWTDDPDSRVDIVSTALADLRGVMRLLAQRPLVRFMAIGVLSTIAYATLYLLLRTWLVPGISNALALAVTAVANTQANRRFTFGMSGRRGLLRQHAAGALVYLLALALTGGALGVLHAIDPRPARALEVAVLVLASALATVSRYVALRSWVFSSISGFAGEPPRDPPPGARVAPTSSGPELPMVRIRTLPLARIDVERSSRAPSVWRR